MTTYFTARDADDSWDDDLDLHHIVLGYDMPLDPKALLWVPLNKSHLVSQN